MHPSRHAETWPEKAAYIMAGTGERITYRMLDDRSNQGAQLFRSLGLKTGDHVAFLIENHPRFYDLCWAAQRTGLYFTAISTRLSASEVAYIVEDCEAKLFVTTVAHAHIVEELGQLTENVAHCYMIDGARDGFASYEEASGAFPAEPVADEASGVDMLYSSGTTGRPKGVKRPLSGLAIDDPGISLDRMTQLYNMGDATVYLSPAPLYHAAPLRFTMAILRLGGTVVVMEKFDPEQALSCIEKYQVTHSQWVPSMFVRFLKMPAEIRTRYDLSSHQVAIHAAAPCPVPVKEQMIEWWGPIIDEYYAGSESIGSTWISSEDWLAHKGSVGQGADAVIHILDDDFNELPAGEEGAIYFEGGTTFTYHNDPGKTAGAMSPQGWATLGDIGRLDEEGFLYLTDRKAFMIISGGVNIYPQETENALITHPEVADVAVFGVPNEDFGEEVKAVVQPMDWGRANTDFEEELIAYCRSQISAIKCPKTVDFERELPRHPTGKLYKRLLRDRYWGKHESKIV